MCRYLSILVAGLLCAVPPAVQARINIFACEPEWAALAAEIGGDKAAIFAATHAGQDPHHIRARPSLITKARRADLIFCSGAGLEVGWLPVLLQKAGADVQPGSVGYLMAAEFVPILEKPVAVDRGMGDLHPQGNPHVHLNPHNVLLVGQELVRRLDAIDAANASFYRDQLRDFSSRWRAAILRWENAAAGLRGMPIVVHHQTFSYLIDWLALTQVAALEPKPGIPPTAAYLRSLLRQLKAEPAAVIIRTPYDPDDASGWLSGKTGISAIVLPYTIAGAPESGDLFALFDRSIGLLQEAAHDR